MVLIDVDMYICICLVVFGSGVYGFVCFADLARVKMCLWILCLILVILMHVDNMSVDVVDV